MLQFFSSLMWVPGSFPPVNMVFVFAFDNNTCSHVSCAIFNEDCLMCNCEIFSEVALGIVFYRSFEKK